MRVVQHFDQTVRGALPQPTPPGRWLNLLKNRLEGGGSEGAKRLQPANPVFEDNATAISWSEGAVGGSDRAKHIDLREHYVHDAVAQGVLKLVKVPSADNLADLFTKPLPKDRFLVLRKKLMGF